MKKIGIAEIKLTDAEIEAAVRVLKSGALRQGKQCEAFEREFAEKVGAKHAVTCANGSAALHLAYMALLEPGDEVLVPSFTFIATGSMVTAMGGKPVICDVDRETFLIDLQDAEHRITERTKAIAPVHLFGNPCDVDAVRAFAEKHNLKVIWDAAQAHGTRFKSKDIGGLDDVVTYSFYPSKNMFVGEGGMICTNDDEVAYKLRFLRTHGQTGKYYHTMLGYNYRMTDVEAAIGREQLKRLDAMLEVRRRNARMLNEGLAQIPGITPQRITEGGESSWHQYCV
ncbi:DegT/DnrJ/EryC1/StrS family aminotransferase, partial [Candidatus Parcubacteria bacterium]